MERIAEVNDYLYGESLDFAWAFLVNCSPKEDDPMVRELSEMWGWDNDNKLDC